MSRIIVKNLPSTITEKKLREIFQEKGCITDLQLKYNKAGVFRKFAFVGYKTEDEAKQAKEYFNNTFVFTSKLQVEICSDLNDPNRPKAWKEYLKEKEKVKVIEAKQGSLTKENEKKIEKDSKSEENDVRAELKKDPKYKEFMAIHEDRKSKPLWADDIGALEDSESSSDDDDGDGGGGGYDTSQKGKSKENPVSDKEHKTKVEEEMDESETDKEEDAAVNAPLLCRSVRVGSYKIHPLNMNRFLDVSLNADGISFISLLQSDSNKNVKVIMKPSDVVHMWVHFGKCLPVIFIFTTTSYAESLRKLLNMFNDEECLFDPNSDYETRNKITFLIDSITEEQCHFFRHRFLNEQIVKEIDLKTANKVLIKSTPCPSKPKVETMKLSPFVYTVKLRNLPYSCKKKQVKEFFHPLKIASLRIPQKSKGFCYVSFKTEKDMNKALNKHRGYLGGHRIDVVKYTKKENCEDNTKNEQVEGDKKVDLDLLAETGRIYVRNLYYSVTASELEELFSKYGPLAEVYLPIDRSTKKTRGFAFVTYLFAEHAVKAFSDLDGKGFQGRLLHLIPAEPKKEEEIDENDTNYKKKKEAKMKALSGNAYNWNILFLGMNAVADTISEKYNVEKSKLLSTHSSKESVAVRMAIAETQLVLETRKFLIENGVQLDAFSQPAAKRSKTVIIVKHLPAKTSSEELHEQFSQYGTIHRIIVPPSGMVAIVEFQDPTEAKEAFKKMHFRRFHHLPLYLEWAPVDGLKEPPPKTEENESTSKGENSAEVDESQVYEGEPPPGTTLFIKNLNFNTKEEDFRKLFAKCGPLHSASISTKKDIKTGKLLSMGFGFVQYKTKESAVRALSELQQSKLDGHALEIKFSTRASMPSDKVTKKRKKYEVKKQLTSKILVRNIPFEASEKEIRELFGQFGMLKSVRMPMKMGIKNEHRGFGFVDYMTKSDAKSAFESVCHSTHLLGRRLVLEWANPESEDVDEIRKKTARDFAGSGGPPMKLKKSKLKEDVALASTRSVPTDE